MPVHYKTDLLNSKTLAVINKFMIFDRLTQDELATLLTLAPEKGQDETDQASERVACLQKFQKGETVIREGEYGGCSFWVVKGIFDVIQDGVHIASLNTPGEVFGEMSIFEKIPRVATVRAVTEGICLCLDMAVVDRVKDARIEGIIREEFAAIMMSRLEETRLWLEQERQRIDEKYAELLESKKRLKDRLKQNS